MIVKSRRNVDAEREQNIKCDKCQKLFHILCTKVDKRNSKIF